MKKNLFVVTILVIITSVTNGALAQNANYEDVVYLKNGSIIHGTIIEQIPNESLKVKTKDGSVFVYNLSEVSKLSKEEMVNSTPSSENPYKSIMIPSYNQIKRNYNSRMYVPQPSDPYNPTLSGFCSWFIPGLGQVLSNETGRGLGFFGAYVGCSLVMGIGSGVMVNAYYDDEYYTGTLMFLAGAAGMLAVDIWSIVDAVHVSKVKNMYYNDMKSKTSSLDLELSPYIGQISMCDNIVRPVGLTMTLKF